MDVAVDTTMKKGWTDFIITFSLEDIPNRTRKHIAAPEKFYLQMAESMFLRWMVRSDIKGVDFGIWKNISPAQLICPIDLHVARVAKHFQPRNVNRWLDRGIVQKCNNLELWIRRTLCIWFCVVWSGCKWKSSDKKMPECGYLRSLTKGSSAWKCTCIQNEEKWLPATYLYRRYQRVRML